MSCDMHQYDIWVSPKMGVYRRSTPHDNIGKMMNNQCIATGFGGTLYRIPTIHIQMIHIHRHTLLF